MIRYERRFWLLAAGLAALAGFVDAIGFMKLGGFFVSFMSGNSTRFAVGGVVDPAAAAVAGSLVAAFVGGVMAATFLAVVVRSHRKAAVLGLVASTLCLAALLNGAASERWSAWGMAAAMGAANAVFQRDGEVSIGVTYMTGTLVKLGQRLATALIGPDRWSWLPYLLLWCSLVAGAAIGAFVCLRFGPVAIWGAAVAAVLLALYAAWIDPPERHT